jgi:peptidylprolyl isomerase
MVGRRTFMVGALAVGACALGVASAPARAFVPPLKGKSSRPEDPMVTVPPASGPIPAPSTVAAAPPDAEVSPSGLRSKVLRAGSGLRPTTADTVVVHYTGWTTDGKMFDSSVIRKTAATFPLNALIKGFTEGLQLMRVGEQRRLWIPGALGYGDVPKPGRPTGLLVFDIELIAIRS